MNEDKKRQVHIWLDETDFIEYEKAAEGLGIENGGSKMIKAELVSQAKIKRQLRLISSQKEVQQPTRKLSAWEQLNIDIHEG